MSKNKSPLKIAQEEAQKAIERTNLKIDELGKKTRNLYDALTQIQALFDKIRNVPNDDRLKYENLKKACLTWKQQADKIDDDYKKAIAQGGGTAGGGAAVGVGLAALGPTAAMGVATTFGVASTGTAISSLSGAAATNAALAWLGGGALATGGGGMAAGEALLALAGPIGWSIAGVSLAIGGIIFFMARKDKKRLENIYILISKRDVKSYNLATIEIQERITRIINEIPVLNTASKEIKSFGTDYSMMTEQQQYKLGSYVNLMYASTNLLVSPILGLKPKYTEDDFMRYELSMTKHSNQDPYSAFQKPYGNNIKEVIVALANLLYKIDMDEKDEQVLHKSLKKNKDFLKSANLKNNDFSIEIVLTARDALKYKYENTTF